MGMRGVAGPGIALIVRIAKFFIVAVAPAQQWPRLDHIEVRLPDLAATKVVFEVNNLRGPLTHPQACTEEKQAEQPSAGSHSKECFSASGQPEQDKHHHVGQPYPPSQRK